MDQPFSAEVNIEDAVTDAARHLQPAFVRLARGSRLVRITGSSDASTRKVFAYDDAVSCQSHRHHTTAATQTRIGAPHLRFS